MFQLLFLLIFLQCTPAWSSPYPPTRQLGTAARSLLKSSLRGRTNPVPSTSPQMSRTPASWPTWCSSVWLTPVRSVSYQGAHSGTQYYKIHLTHAEQRGAITSLDPLSLCLLIHSTVRGWLPSRRPHCSLTFSLLPTSTPCSPRGFYAKLLSRLWAAGCRVAWGYSIPGAWLCVNLGWRLK